MHQLFSKEEMLRRRENLFDKMEDFSILIIFAGVEKTRSADSTYPFVVNRNFYYLTQIEQADSVLVMVKTPASKETYLFVSPYDEKKEKWTGKILKVNEAREISFIDNVLFSDRYLVISTM